jgi:hypothetical protein
VTSAKWTVVAATAAARLPVAGVDEAVAGVQHAVAAAHPLPSLARVGGVAGLPRTRPSNARTESQPAPGRAGLALGRDGFGLEPGERAGDLGRVGGVDHRLVHVADDHLGLDAGVRSVLRRAGEAEARISAVTRGTLPGPRVAISCPAV